MPYEIETFYHMRHRRRLSLLLAARDLEWIDFTFYCRMGFTLAVIGAATVLGWLA